MCVFGARNLEHDVLVVGVEAQEEGVIFNPVTSAIRFSDGIAVEPDHQRLAEVEVPVIGRHDTTLIGQPGNVTIIGFRTERATAQEAAASEDWVFRTQLSQELGVFDQFRVGTRLIPVDPGQTVVLAVDVVVALLATSHFVTVANHRSALGQQESGQEVTTLAGAQRNDALVVGRAFHTAVPRTVVGLAIAVVLAVGHIVLLVVADQVVEGETVMRGHEVNRRSWAAVIVCIQVRGAGDT